MKTKITLSALLLLTSALVLFYLPCYNPSLPQGFAPIDVVYHGSTSQNIKLLKPQINHFRDKNEVALIFATPSFRLASCYLFRWDDSWVHQEIAWKDDNKANYQISMVISDKERFIKEDKGGSIYILPATGFEFDDKGLGIYEWTSKEKIQPFSQINFSSSLEAMQMMGVKVYFVDKDQFQEYLNLSGDEREKFLAQLEKRD